MSLFVPIIFCTLTELNWSVYALKILKHLLLSVNCFISPLLHYLILIKKWRMYTSFASALVPWVRDRPKMLQKHYTWSMGSIMSFANFLPSAGPLSFYFVTKNLWWRYMSDKKSRYLLYKWISNIFINTFSNQSKGRCTGKGGKKNLLRV